MSIGQSIFFYLTQNPRIFGRWRVRRHLWAWVWTKSRITMAESEEARKRRERRKFKNMRPGGCASCGKRTGDRREYFKYRARFGLRVCGSCMGKHDPIVYTPEEARRHNRQDCLFGKTPLHYLAKSNLHYRDIRFVSPKTLINVRDDRGETPLDVAIHSRNRFNVGWLLREHRREYIDLSTYQSAMRLALGLRQGPTLQDLWEHSCHDRRIVSGLCIDDARHVQPKKHSAMLARLLLLGAETWLGRGVPEWGEISSARTFREAWSRARQVWDAGKALPPVLWRMVFEYALDVFLVAESSRRRLR